MTEERWIYLVGKIKDDFEFIEEGEYELEEGPGTSSFVIFNGPVGKMMLERVVRPVVLGKKTLSSRRIGGETSVQYQYSDSEFSEKLVAYKWNAVQDDWEEMSTPPPLG